MVRSHEGHLTMNEEFDSLPGRIEFEEFVDIVADFYFKKFSRAEILEAFRRFDHNHDGYIEADELKNILARLGRNFSHEEVRSLAGVISPVDSRASRFFT